MVGDPRPSERLRRRELCAIAALLALCAIGCGDDAAHARKMIRTQQLPAMTKVIRQDLRDQLAGLAIAARRLAPGFAPRDAATREHQMRLALSYVQKPPKGVHQFMASPMSFLAAVGTDGKVIARDLEPDPMKGRDFGALYPVVHAALTDGRSGYGLGEFRGPPGTKSDWSILFVAPARSEGHIVGAVVSGIPLWRLAQQLSRQMQLDHVAETGLTLWAYTYKGDRVFHFGTPPSSTRRCPMQQRGVPGSRGAPTASRDTSRCTVGPMRSGSFRRPSSVPTSG